MANPAAAAQHQARGGDGAAGRPAAEQAQGTSSPWLLGAAPAPAPDQQPRLAGAAGEGGGPRSRRHVAARCSAGQRGGRGGRRTVAAGAGGRGRGRAAPPGTRRCPVPGGAAGRAVEFTCARVQVCTLQWLRK